MNAVEVLQISAVVPVIALEDASLGVDLACALYEGGIGIMEVTLRTKAALEAIEQIRLHMPKMRVGAGTICSVMDASRALDAGSEFLFSPGISRELLEFCAQKEVSFIPGVGSASEVMLAQNSGIEACKLFPATVVGGVDALRAFAGPFGGMKFCPTGGVNLANMRDFLALSNVLCVGGSWLCTKELLEKRDFTTITTLAKEALTKAKG